MLPGYKRDVFMWYRCTQGARKAFVPAFVLVLLQRRDGISQEGLPMCFDIQGQRGEVLAW